MSTVMDRLSVEAGEGNAHGTRPSLRRACVCLLALYALVCVCDGVGLNPFNLVAQFPDGYDGCCVDRCGSMLPLWCFTLTG